MNESLPILELNSNLEEVKILQEKLKILDYYSGNITGSFGPTTKSAVKRFQEDYDLLPTGIVNQDTWAVLFYETRPPFPQLFRATRPTLRLGSTGDDVKELQQELTTLLYYNGPINGTFDQATQSAVKSLQLINKLTADGIVGRDTWSALVYLYSPLTTCNGSDITPEPVEPNENTYTVVGGDTLWSIAHKYSLTVDELKRLNNLTSNTLSIGQVLKVKDNEEEETPNESFDYIVKAGDTLYALARQFNTTVDEIKRLNNLTSNTLSIGQKIQIPQSQSNEPNEDYLIHSVVKGDTLYNLANRYNTTVDEIKRINNLTSNILSLGQELKIPKSSSTPEYIDYIVKAGDTLWSVARNFGTTVTDIKNINNLVTDILSIGQILRILKV